MRGLSRLLRARLHQASGARERGAIGVTVAVLFGVGVLLGTGALVVDVGQLYQARAELQNGADAGALAVARGCAQGAPTCLPATANSYANANSKDGLSNVDLVCGYAGPGVLPSCPATTSELASCPSPAPSTGATYVEVHTSTLSDGGSTLLPPVFARTLAGNESYDGTNVRACARASWGSPQAAITIGFTISYCEWLNATSDGISYAAPPPYPPNTPPTPSQDRVLKLHSTSTTTCPGGPAGADGPGMFGWVQDPDDNCSVNLSGTTFNDDPGASAGTACKSMLATAQANRTVVFVPVFGHASGTGSGGTYTLDGFAAFVVTGYRIPGAIASDWLKPSNDCTGVEKCINGYFTQGLVPAGGVVGGVNLGATVVQLTG